MENENKAGQVCADMLEGMSRASFQSVPGLDEMVLLLEQEALEDESGADWLRVAGKLRAVRDALVTIGNASAAAAAALQTAIDTPVRDDSASDAGRPPDGP